MSKQDDKGDVKMIFTGDNASGDENEDKSAGNNGTIVAKVSDDVKSQNGTS